MRVFLKPVNNFPLKIPKIFLFTGVLSVTFFLLLGIFSSYQANKSRYLFLKNFSTSIDSFASLKGEKNLNVESIAQILWGSVNALRGYEGKNGILGVLNQFEFSNEEKLIIERFRKKLLSLEWKDIWVISNKEMLSILVPKIIQKTLYYPSFMQNHNISFSRFPHFNKEFVLKIRFIYKNLQITDKGYNPLQKGPYSIFLSDIIKAYLYAPVINFAPPMTYDFKQDNFLESKSIMVIYLPSFQTLLVLDKEPLFFGEFWKRDFISFILCILVALFIVLFFNLLPHTYFTKK